MRPNLVILTALLLTTSCAGPKPPSAFLVPVAYVQKSVRVIALRQVAVPADFEEPEPVQRALLEDLIRELEAAGYQIIPPDSVEPIWRETAMSLGGLFDPVTGRFDASKVLEARTRFHAALVQRYRADAVAIPKVVTVQAPTGGGVARWDGTSQHMKTWGKEALDFFTFTGTSGTVKSFSFELALEDMTGRVLYRHRGGIEVAYRHTASGFEPMPRGELFDEPERLEKAVSIALEPLREEGH